MAIRLSFGKQQTAAAPPVRFRAAGDDDRSRNINLLKARRSSAFDLATRLVYEASVLAATNIQVDRTGLGTAVLLEVDAIWHPLPQVDAPTGSGLADAFKQLAGLSAREARWRQSGQFSVVINHGAWDCTVISNGTSGGERIQIALDNGQPPFANLRDLAISPELHARISKSLERDAGLLLFSSPPDSGMIEFLEAAVRDSDRFQRTYYMLENSRRPRPSIENVATRRYDGSSTTINDTLRSIAKEHPDVLIVPELDDADTADAMIAQPAQRRLVLAGIPANDAPEALLRVLHLRCNASRFAGEVTAVGNIRLVRKLCLTCRQPYAPPPQVLMELGLAGSETSALFRASGKIVGERDEPIACPACHGLGYRGRAGVIEWLEVTDEMRSALLSAGNNHLQELKRLAADEGVTSHLREAGTLAATGVTSVQEIVRVLKS